MYQGIEHVAIFSADTTRLRDWYVRHLDMHCAVDNGAGGYFLLLQDGSMIELVPASEPSQAGVVPDVRDRGLRHIALRVAAPDFGAAVHRLVEAGVCVVGESPRQYPEGLATFHFRDPDGNLLHLISRPWRLALAVAPKLASAPHSGLIQGIEHLGIVASDPERLRQWYVDALGFQLIVRDDGHGTAFVLGRDGRSVLEFLKAEREPGLDHWKACGIRHLAISVPADETEGLATRLKALGVEVLDDYKQVVGGVHLFFFRDPEGNVLHLVGRANPLVT